MPQHGCCVAIVSDTAGTIKISGVWRSLPIQPVPSESVGFGARCRNSPDQQVTYQFAEQDVVAALRLLNVPVYISVEHARTHVQGEVPAPRPLGQSNQRG